MDSTELYRQLLGVTTPWTVERVDMDVAHLRVDVHLTHAGGARFACPECAAELAVYDHTEERVWRHLDSCQFQTLLHARPPRVNCPEHGVLRVKLPWAQPGGNLAARRRHPARACVTFITSGRPVGQPGGVHALRAQHSMIES